MKIYCKCALLFVLTIFCSFAFANSLESMGKINTVTKEFLLKNIPVNSGDNIEVKVNQANTTFEVKACAGELTAAFPKNMSTEQATNVEVSCNDAQAWHIYVPVEVQIFSKVVAAKRTLAAKETLTEEDLDYTFANKNRLYNGYFTNIAEVAGKEATYLITAGSILTRKNIALPILIHRNQTVSIIAKSNTIVVTMQGVAKSDGALNTSVKVYNPSSKKTLDAIVVGPNKAEVIM